MDGWLRVDPGISEAALTQLATGIQFDVMVSPYDVPEAIRGYRTRSGKLRIEFRYIDGDEPTASEVECNHVAVFEGKHSGRIHAIEVDCAALRVDAVGLRIIVPEIENQIEQALGSLNTSPDRARNARLAKRAWSQRKQDLLESFSA